MNERMAQPTLRSPLLSLARAAALIIPLGLATLMGLALIMSETDLRGKSEALQVEAPKLADAFGGSTFDLLSTPGIQLVESASGEASAVALLHTEGSPATKLSLCDQAAKGRLNSRLTMRMVEQERADKAIASDTIVVGPRWGAGMPELRLSVVRVDTDSTGSQPVSFRLDRNGAQEARIAIDGLHQEFHNEAWVLWSPAADGHHRFDRALRLRRTTDPGGCPFGSIEVRAYRAAGSPVTQGAIGTGPGADAATPLQVIVLQPGKPVLKAWLPAGHHAVPIPTTRVLEDQELFERATAHGLIQVNGHGAISVTPIEARHVPPGQEWSQERLSLHKRLHAKADGQFVRNAIDRYNNARLTAAVRVLEAPSRWPDMGRSSNDWSVTIDGVGSWGRHGLPSEAARLLDHVPAAVSNWFQVARWPQSAQLSSSVRFTLRLPEPARAGDVVVVMAMGRHVDTPSDSRRRMSCAIDQSCHGNDELAEVEIRLTEGQKELEVSLLPTDALIRVSERSASIGPVGVKEGNLVWDAPSQRSASPLPSRVGTTLGHHQPGHAKATTVRAASGEVLFTQGQPSLLAISLGLGPLVGLGSEHESGVAASLARLVDGPIEARVSLDVRLQRLAEQSLDCIGHRGARHESRRGDVRCTEGERVPRLRKSAIVLLDADRGDILAAASRPLPPPSAAVSELVAFDRYRPTHSRLRWAPWQHDGGPFWAPGSTFKVVDALALETAAATNRSLSMLLDGAPTQVLRTVAQEDGLGFDLGSPCYPSPCRGSRSQVHNYKEARPIDYTQAGRFGLEQALAHSLNTWFAWMVERTDTLARAGRPKVRLLDPRSHPDLRPTLAVAHQLGFGAPLILDGGLLGEHASELRRGDALHVDSSEIDPLDTDADVRRLSLGLRMQATPLQMARVAAAIGSGKIVTPRLLVEINQSTSPVISARLGIRSDRIRRALSSAVASGTARGAFAEPELATMRAGIYGKTGTAPHGDGIHNNAWFIGWIEPNTLPGESRRIAFAVMVSHTLQGQTGGARAAAVVADLLKSHLASSGTN